MSAQTSCPDVGRLRSLVEGRVNEHQQAELTRHLETCKVCLQKVEELAAGGKSWAESAKQLGQAQPAPEPALRRLLDDLKRKAAGEVTGPGAGGEIPLDFLDPPVKPGQLGQLGHYEVLEAVGHGGMGVVLKAFDPPLHRIVAIKVLAPQLATNATARRRFTREAQAAAAVTHDHVVTIHAVAEFRGLPYLVMQYVEGLSLQERLDGSGPLELKEILRIGMQTAAGLAKAHAQGLVHRDIKPANILLENGVQRVKITDFGLARAVDDATLTQSGLVAGTPQYMAPEQARGETVEPRADLFSLGSVLYAMCTGQPPFRGRSSMAVLKRVCEDTPRPIRELNPDIPDWLVAIIEKLQAKEPGERYQSAAEVSELLGQRLALVQHPVSAVRDSAASPHAPPRFSSALSTAGSHRPLASEKHRQATPVFSAGGCLGSLLGGGVGVVIGIIIALNANSPVGHAFEAGRMGVVGVATILGLGGMLVGYLLSRLVAGMSVGAQTARHEGRNKRPEGFAPAVLERADSGPRPTPVGSGPSWLTVCPACGCQFHIPGPEAGQQVYCPQCGQRFVLEEASQDLPVAHGPKARPRKPVAPRRKAPSWVWIVAGVAGVFLLCCGIPAFLIVSWRTLEVQSSGTPVDSPPTEVESTRAMAPVVAESKGVPSLPGGDALDWFPANATLFGVLDLRSFSQVTLESGLGKGLRDKLLPADIKALVSLERLGRIRLDRVAFAFYQDWQNNGKSRLLLRCTGKFDRKRVVELCPELLKPAALAKDYHLSVNERKGHDGERITLISSSEAAPAFGVVADTDVLIARFLDNKAAHVEVVQEALLVRGGREKGIFAVPYFWADDWKGLPPQTCGFLAGLPPADLRNRRDVQSLFPTLPQAVFLSLSVGRSKEINLDFILHPAGTALGGTDEWQVMESLTKAKRKAFLFLDNLPPDFKVKPETPELLARTLERMRLETGNYSNRVPNTYIKGSLSISPQALEALWDLLKDVQLSR
jgi:serine/threonine protein kinase